MRATRRGLLVLGAGVATAFVAGCSQQPTVPLEPSAGLEKAVLVAQGMH